MAVKFRAGEAVIELNDIVEENTAKIDMCKILQKAQQGDITPKDPSPTKEPASGLMSPYMPLQIPLPVPNSPEECPKWNASKTHMI